jgi:AcrR family transcriptional regulator
MVDLEAKVDRLAEDRASRRHLPTSRSCGARGPQATITSEAVFQRALDILDRDGDEALTVRRLADDLGISTRTLYKRMAGRADVIHGAADLHVARVLRDVRARVPLGSRETSWCIALHNALVTFPNATAILGDNDVRVIETFIRDVLLSGLGSHVASHLVAECAVSLANVTINDAMRRVRNASGAPPQGDFALRTTIKWIVAGTRAQAI